VSVHDTLPQIRARVAALNDERKDA